MPNTGLIHNRAVAEQRVLAAVTAIGSSLALEIPSRPQRHRRPEVNEVRQVEWTADSLETIAASLDGAIVAIPAELEVDDEASEAVRAQALEALITAGLPEDVAGDLVDVTVLLAGTGDGDVELAAGILTRAVGVLPETDRVAVVGLFEHLLGTAQVTVDTTIEVEIEDDDEPAEDPADDDPATDAPILPELTVEGDEDEPAETEGEGDDEGDADVDESQLTPQQKAARTRKRNQAARLAGVSD